jgi:hypothetical protein
MREGVRPSKCPALMIMDTTGIVCLISLFIVYLASAKVISSTSTTKSPFT